MTVKTALPRLDAARLNRVLDTLTRARLKKYLLATHNDEQQALRLYVINAKLSAAFLTDLHYVEIALRNRFDTQLSAAFGASWFTDARLLALLDPRSCDILAKAQRDAKKGMPASHPTPPGKVIAELTFGFWIVLTDRKFEHKLWVPYLHKAFLPGKPPRRATFNTLLEKLRQLRNRGAHHEPIFQMDLLAAQRTLCEVAMLLCPATAHVMTQTSTVKREVMALARYRSRRSV